MRNSIPLFNTPLRTAWSTPGSPVPNRIAGERLYFLTFNGLSIYNGARFTNYTTTDGLGDNLVKDIWEAGEDSFLVATNTEKVNTLVKGKLGNLQTNDHRTPLINRFLPDDHGNLYTLGDFYSLECLYLQMGP